MFNYESIEYDKCSNDISYFIENYCVYENFTFNKNEFRNLKLKILNNADNQSLKENIRKFDKIKLKEHQKNILHEYINSRNIINIHSRQMGVTTIYVLIILHELLFNKNLKIILYSNSEHVSINIFNKLIYYYNHLPSFLKKNITYKHKNKICFDNKCEIINIRIIYEINTFDILFLPNFAHIYNINKKYEDFIKKYMNDKNRVIIETQPNGKNNILYDLINKYELENDTLFKVIKNYWYDLPDKEQIDINEIINILGIEHFEEMYNLKFL